MEAVHEDSICGTRSAKAEERPRTSSRDKEASPRSRQRHSLAWQTEGPAPPRQACSVGSGQDTPRPSFPPDPLPLLLMPHLSTLKGPPTSTSLLPPLPSLFPPSHPDATQARALVLLSQASAHGPQKPPENAPHPQEGAASSSPPKRQTLSLPGPCVDVPPPAVPSPSWLQPPPETAGGLPQLVTSRPEKRGATV